MLVTLSEDGVRDCVMLFLRWALRFVSAVIILFCVFSCVAMFLSLFGCCLCYPFAQFGNRPHCVSIEPLFRGGR